MLHRSNHVIANSVVLETDNGVRRTIPATTKSSQRIDNHIVADSVESHPHYVGFSHRSRYGLFPSFFVLCRGYGGVLFLGIIIHIPGQTTGQPPSPDAYRVVTIGGIGV